MANLEVHATNGTGHVYVDTLPLTEIDTQASARIAKEAVEEVLGISLDNYDIFFVIRSDSPIVGGPSAGGAMATALMAFMLNTTVERDIVMTGTVNLDGSLGPVGGLIEKAQAVAEHGGTVFLIPEGQNMVTIEEQKNTMITNSIDSDSTREQVNLAKYAKGRWNLTIIEVSSIAETFEHMTGYHIQQKFFSINRSQELDIAMEAMAKSFLKDTESRYKKTKLLLDNSSLTYQTERQLKSLLEEQEKRISDAGRMINRGEYYSASSFCYAASAQLRFIENYIELAESGGNSADMENRLRSAEIFIDDVSSELESLKNMTDNANDIEIILLSSGRLDEANAYMKDAWKGFYNEENFYAAYGLGYAEERAQTVHRWINFSKSFTGSRFSFNFTLLKDICRIRMGEVNSFISYAKMMGLDTNSSQVLLNRAVDSFDSGDYAASLSSAVSARSEVEALMKIGSMGENASGFLDSQESGIARDIENAKKAGVIPIMAMNYYEYAKTLENESPEAALLYFTYARNFAKTSLNLANMMNGNYITTSNTESVIITRESENEIGGINTIVLMILSTAIGFVAGFLARRSIQKIHKGH